LPNGEAHLDRAPDDTRQHPLDRSEQAILKPVSGVSILDAENEGAVLVGQQVDIADPGVKRGSGHFHLKLPKRRLPDLFRIHRSSEILSGQGLTNTTSKACRRPYIVPVSVEKLSLLHGPRPGGPSDPTGARCSAPYAPAPPMVDSILAKGSARFKGSAVRQPKNNRRFKMAEP
jgi:hypothetical protein